MIVDAKLILTFLELKLREFGNNLAIWLLPAESFGL